LAARGNAANDFVKAGRSEIINHEFPQSLDGINSHEPADASRFVDRHTGSTQSLIKALAMSPLGNDDTAIARTQARSDKAVQRVKQEIIRLIKLHTVSVFTGRCAESGPRGPARLLF
jgi:hypothetical protein